MDMHMNETHYFENKINFVLKKSFLPKNTVPNK